MSVVTALSFVLIAGFVAIGLVGFLGWRQRMRGGTGASVHRILTPSSPARRSLTSERRSRAVSEGAGL
jgi:hypothetical protein